MPSMQEKTDSGIDPFHKNKKTPKEYMLVGVFISGLFQTLRLKKWPAESANFSSDYVADERTSFLYLAWA